MVGRGQIEASGWHLQDLKGEPRAVADARFSAHEYQLDTERRAERAKTSPLPLTALFAEHIAEAKPAPASIKAWQRQVQAFVAFVGYDDARRVTPDDVVAWKKHLLAAPSEGGRGLCSKTVRDTYLSVLKTIFKSGRENNRVFANPAERVTVRGPKRVMLRERGLTDAEANLILSASLASPPAKLTPERVLARRWVPWLCAYTGARVNEITQLRYEDVRQIGGIWTILITPEAGSVKTGIARLTALHPHIVEQGFPAILKGRSGPIFYDPKRYRGGLDGNPQWKKTGEHLQRWVRDDVGVADPNVQPSHGWRHRFKTQARLANMDPEVRDVIQGHAARTESAGYGDTLPEVTLREVSKLPR